MGSYFCEAGGFNFSEHDKFFIVISIKDQVLSLLLNLIFSINLR